MTFCTFRSDTSIPLGEIDLGNILMISVLYSCKLDRCFARKLVLNKLLPGLKRRVHFQIINVSRNRIRNERHFVKEPVSGIDERYAHRQRCL